MTEKNWYIAALTRSLFNVTVRSNEIQNIAIIYVSDNIHHKTHSTLFSQCIDENSHIKYEASHSISCSHSSRYTQNSPLDTIVQHSLSPHPYTLLYCSSIAFDTYGHSHSESSLLQFHSNSLKHINQSLFKKEKFSSHRNKSFDKYSTQGASLSFVWSTSKIFHYSEMDNTYAHKMWAAEHSINSSQQQNILKRIKCAEGVRWGKSREMENR